MKYISKPVRNGWEDDEQSGLTITVIEDDDPAPTGILNPQGNMLYRAPSKVRAGFVLRPRG